MYELTYSEVKVPLRESLERGAKYAWGLTAKQIIVYHAGQNGWEEITEIFDEYPDCVIEFTIFNRSVGTLFKPWIIWEARDY